MSTSFAEEYQRTGTQTHHCREDALDDVEFELLLEGATRLDEPYALQSAFAVVVLGRLGLRRGELTHLRADWIDERNQMLSIPRQQDCTIGKGDTDVCGYCRQLAEQRTEYNPTLSMETALEMQWAAKTDAAARDVYFGFSPRAELYLRRFTDRYERWPVSSTGVNRRVKDAAAAADRLDSSDVRPHALRATAATKLAAEGLEMHALMQHFGWAKPQTAEVYLSRNGKNTARQLDAIQSR